MKKLIKKFINIFKRNKDKKEENKTVCTCSFIPHDPLNKKDDIRTIKGNVFIGINRKLEYEELQELNDGLESTIFYDNTVKKMFELITSFYSKHRSYFKSIGEELEWDTKTPDEWLDKLKKYECENNKEVIVKNFRLIKYHYVSLIKNFLAMNCSGFTLASLFGLIPPDELDHCVSSGNWGTTAKVRRRPLYPNLRERVGEVIATEKLQICTRDSYMKIAEVERPIKSIWKFEFTPLSHGSSSNDVGLDNIFASAITSELWSIVYYNHVGSYAKPILFESNDDCGFNEIKVDFINKPLHPTRTEYFDSMEDIRDYCEENGLYMTPIYSNTDLKEAARIKTRKAKK